MYFLYEKYNLLWTIIFKPENRLRDFYEKRNYNPKKGHTFHSENITCLGKNN